MTIKSLIRFIIEDIKKDIEYIKHGNFIKDLEKKGDKMCTLSLTSIIKDNWLFFLIVILAFITGYFIAAVHYQNVVNDFITNILENATLLYSDIPYEQQILPIV